MLMCYLRSGICFYLLIHVVRAVSNDTLNEIPDSYVTLAAGNSLWTNLVRNCKKPSLTCVQKNFYEYLDGVLDSRDVELMDGIKLNKNSVNFSVVTQKEDDGIRYDEVKRSSPFEEVAGALRNKLVGFLMSHDLELRLPEMLFEGSVLKLSPRSLEEDGALVKIDVVPKISTDVQEGRIFFKKIKKFIGEKLLMALLAIVLVVKLIVVKFLFLLPLVMGVAAAKKLLLKVLLFFFPVLTHLFKLCPYYAPTKYHQHNHHISHIHHLPPSLHHGVELDHPPHDHGHYDHALEYYSDGPAFSDYHRKVFDAKGKKPLEDNEVGWGLGQGQSKRGSKFSPAGNRPLTPSEIENMIQKAEQEATLKARLQEEQKRVENENKRLQEQIKQSLKLQEKLKLQSIIVKQNSKLVAANILQNANVVPTNVVPPPHILHAVPSASLQHATYIHPPPMAQPSSMTQPFSVAQPSSMAQPPPIAQAQIHPVYRQETIYRERLPYYGTKDPVYDPFYSPILEKIDRIFLELGYKDEACRERLICSMYKNPIKFSPHSNLISAELSRDPSELEKPTSPNSAVVRFYTYVQAARDGQDNRDCLRLYPACPINMER